MGLSEHFKAAKMASILAGISLLFATQASFAEDQYKTRNVTDVLPESHRFENDTEETRSKRCYKLGLAKNKMQSMIDFVNKFEDFKHEECSAITKDDCKKRQEEVLGHYQTAMQGVKNLIRKLCTDAPTFN